MIRRLIPSLAFLIGFALGAAFLLLTVLAGIAFAHEARHAASIRSIYDGDTVRADLVLGLGLVQHDQPIRLVGYDTPELGGRAQCAAEAVLARDARLTLVELVAAAGRVEIEVVDPRDAYGRIAARLLLDGEDIAESMIAAGVARAYDGKSRRQGWCD